MTFTPWLIDCLLRNCFHREQVGPFTIDGESYRVCLGCSIHIPWQYVGEPLKPPRPTEKVEPQSDARFLSNIGIKECAN